MNPKVIILVKGGFWTFFSLMGLFQLLIRKFTGLSSTLGEGRDPTEALFDDVSTGIEDLWFTYFPILLIISLLYLGFGLVFDKIKPQRMMVHLFLSALSFLWAFFYAFSALDIVLKMLALVGSDLILLQVIFGGAAFGGFLFVFVIFCGADLWVFRLLRKQN